jgi:hypothetical protein
MMRQAADRFHQAAQDNPTILLEDLRPREIVSASRNLEGTYLDQSTECHPNVTPSRQPAEEVLRALCCTLQ